MGASAYVGRVGGLAVALGVGIAVATGGQGVAWADDTGNQTAKTAQEGPETGDKAGAEAGVTGTTTGEAGVTGASGSDPTGPGLGRTAFGKRPVSTVSVQNGSTILKRLADLSEKVDRDLKKALKDATPKAVTDEKADAKTDEKPTGGTPQAVETKPAETTRSLTSRSSKSGAAPHVDSSTPLRLTAAKPDPATTTEVVRKVEQAAVVATTAVQQRISAAVQAVTAPVAAPVAAITAATEPPAAAVGSPAVLSRVLGVIGLNPLASGSPESPVQPWALGALMALASRRETEQSVSVARTAAAGGTAATAAVAAVAPYDPAKDYVVTPTPVSGNTDYIANVTGPGGLNDTVNRFGIGGTDVGIIWDNGIKDNPATLVNEHQVLIAFGDTFSQRNPVRTGVWRMNTLFRSTDTTLSNGMYIPDGIPHDPGMYSGTPESNPNFSREIIGNYHYGIGPEVTMIPTAAISVPGAGKNGATRQYVNYMAVRSWDTPGRWTTNYSAIAYSDDNGQNWTVVPPESVRPAAAGRSTRPFVNGNQNFQQFAYVKGAVVDANGVPIKDATGQPKTDGYVYAYGTPAGRGGTAYLSRVKEGQILDQTKYEYWSGTAWVANNPAAAKPILPGTTTSSWFGLVKTTTYPTVGEMSVQYNAYEKKYVMLYADQNNNVVIRKADKPEGPWSTPTTLVTSAKMPGLYAPMVHPWSSTDNLSAADQQYLYWNLSTWDDYQVKLMRTDLSKV